MNVSPPSAWAVAGALWKRPAPTTRDDSATSGRSVTISSASAADGAAKVDTSASEGM